jgi:Positive regulator of sigma(E), RseC/MucC
MPEYEGFVASLGEDGRAEVLVQPERACIVGSPEASSKVCHCTSSSSQVTLEALNPLQAAVGDRVAVRVEASALMRNAGALIGIPILALILGWASSLLASDGHLFGVPLRFLLVFLSLPLGLAAGLVLYRRLSGSNVPVINRIIQRRSEMASSFAEQQEPPCEFIRLCN